jgi:mono/diheme cytochrome c family protein
MMPMKRSLWRRMATLVAASSLVVVSWAWAQAQRNGEEYSTVPKVERTDYDMSAFIAPLTLSETEMRGRKLFAQRCANCHGGTAQRPGPPLGQQTVGTLGEASIREKVRKGSSMMPGFEYTLQTSRIDDIIAFLKTYTPPPRREPSGPAE